MPVMKSIESIISTSEAMLNEHTKSFIEKEWISESFI